MSIQATIEGIEREARSGQEVIIGQEQYDQDQQLREAIEQLIKAMPGDRTQTKFGRLEVVKEPAKGRIVIRYAQPAN